MNILRTMLPLLAWNACSNPQSGTGPAAVPLETVSSPPEAVPAYRVQNGDIYRNDEKIVMQGVNWSGFETDKHVVDGLWKRKDKDIAADIRNMGFNAVRLPVSAETLSETQGVTLEYAAVNPHIAKMKRLEALDHIVRISGENGLYVLLDFHGFVANDADGKAITPLWYDENHSEGEWLSALRLLAERYRDAPNVVGIELKNEPHNDSDNPRRSATWGGDPRTDWKLAAERGAHAVLTVNPNLLVFVQGIQDTELCATDVPHFWGGNLCAQGLAPLAIPADKLVLTPHVYGPDLKLEKPLPFFGAKNFPRNMPAIWENDFGFLAGRGYAVIPTEFGAAYRDGTPGQAWMDGLLDYMKAKGLCSFFYWALNVNTRDGEGIYLPIPERDPDWQTKDGKKLAALQNFMRECPK